MTAVTLECPNGCAPVVSLRRPPHAPCLVCAAAGRGIVQRTVQGASAAAAPTEAREPEPARRVLGEMNTAGFSWDCAQNGHVAQGGVCIHCGDAEPANPAAPWPPLAVVAFALALLLPRAALAQWAPPNGPEVAVLAAAETLILVDTLQSIKGAREGAREVGLSSVLLGEHPSTEAQAAASAAGGILLGAVWWALPPRWRLLPAAGVAGIELVSVVTNFSQGLTPWGCALVVRGRM